MSTRFNWGAYLDALPYLAFGGGAFGGIGGLGLGTIDYLLTPSKEADFYNQVIARGLGYGLSGALGGTIGLPAGLAIGVQDGLPFTGGLGGYGLLSGGLGPMFTYLLSSGNYYHPQDVLERMGWGALIGGGYGAFRGALIDDGLFY